MSSRDLIFTTFTSALGVMNTNMVQMPKQEPSNTFLDGQIIKKRLTTQKRASKSFTSKTISHKMASNVHTMKPEIYYSRERLPC